MTTQGQQAAEAWSDPAIANAWVERDAAVNLLDLPRAIAAELVAAEPPASGVVLDIGSGPGAFLAAVLDRLPDTTGVWSDASATMREHAEANLARFGGRVRFVMADMTALGGADLPRDVGVVLSSRATHHLDVAALHSFYADTAGRLVPGGWLINLDHVGPSDVWDRRLRAIRPGFVGRSGGESTHHHNYPLAAESDHLAGYAAAGIDDVEIAWKAFYTCLFAGKKPTAATDH